MSIFGECPKPDADLLSQEIHIVKSVDPTRPIIITDSGELSFWGKSSSYADILGITLYRFVWNPVIGYFGHIYPPAFYRYRASNVIQNNPALSNVIVMELQAEPWINGPSITEASLAEQYSSMDLNKLKSIVDYTESAGFNQAYFWGAEWWYWLKIKHGDEQFWQYAKTFWQ